MPFQSIGLNTALMSVQAPTIQSTPCPINQSQTFVYSLLGRLFPLLLCKSSPSGIQPLGIPPPHRILLQKPPGQCLVQLQPVKKQGCIQTC